MDFGSLPSVEAIRGQDMVCPNQWSSRLALSSLAIAKQLSTAKSSDVNLSTQSNATPSNPSTGPPNSSLMTLLVSKGLGWDRFKQAVMDNDIAICYDMSVKEFE